MLRYFRYAERVTDFAVPVAMSLLVLFACSDAFTAETIYYVNDKGAVIFVEHESMIPAKYKAGKRKLDDGIETPALQDKKTVKKDDSGDNASGKKEEKDSKGNTPAYWRARYKALVAERDRKTDDIRELETQRDEVSRQLDSARSKAYLVGDGQSINSAATLEVKMREADSRVKIATMEIDKLNRKISVEIIEEIFQAGGQPQWLLRDEEKK